MEPYFESDHVTLYCGDYVKVLQTLFRASTFAAVITDPPYGTTNLKWDKKIDLREFWFNMYEVARD